MYEFVLLRTTKPYSASEHGIPRDLSPRYDSHVRVLALEVWPSSDAGAVRH